MTALDLAALADRVQGEWVGAVEGVRVIGAAPLADAGEGHITLIDDEKHLDRLMQSAAAAVVTPRPLHGVTIPQLVVGQPHEAFALIIQSMRPIHHHARPWRVHPSAVISDSAAISPRCWIDARVTIDDDCHVGEGTHLHPGVTLMPGCRVGRDCQLFPGVVLYPGTQVGDRVTLHAGVVLGAYGFGYKTVAGVHQSTSQLGWVEIEDDVEIGADTTIDRGTYGATRIGQGTKIDNLVQIAHNCRIGRHNLICAHVGIAGSCTTGDYVVLAGQVGLRDHIHIGDRTMVGAQSGVAGDLAPDQICLGSPAIPRYEQAQLLAALSKLPEIRKSLRRLESQVQLMAQSKAA